MEKIKYSDKFLKIVNDVSLLCRRDKDGNSPIRFMKDEEGVHVKIRNLSSTVTILLDASSSDLDFPENELCFYDFRDFYQYFTSFNKPELSIGIINEGNDNETEAIVISENKRKLNYPTSDSEVIGKENFKTPIVLEKSTSFNFSSENLSSLNKILGLYKDPKMLIQFKFSGKELKINIFSKLNNNTYEETLELNEEVSEDFEVVISQEVFKYLLKTDYVVEFCEEYCSLKFYVESGTTRISIIATPEDEE